jgi:hypothetical protein
MTKRRLVRKAAGRLDLGQSLRPVRRWCETAPDYIASWVWKEDRRLGDETKTERVDGSREAGIDPACAKRRFAGGNKKETQAACRIDKTHGANHEPRSQEIAAQGRRLHSSRSPITLPVLRLTKCRAPQALHTTASYWSAGVSSPSDQSWTLACVVGQVKTNGGICKSAWLKRPQRGVRAGAANLGGLPPAWGDWGPEALI